MMLIYMMNIVNYVILVSLCRISDSVIYLTLVSVGDTTVGFLTLGAVGYLTVSDT